MHAFIKHYFHIDIHPQNPLVSYLGVKLNKLFSILETQKLMFVIKNIDII